MGKVEVVELEGNSTCTLYGKKLPALNSFRLTTLTHGTHWRGSSIIYRVAQK